MADTLLLTHCLCRYLVYAYTVCVGVYCQSVRSDDTCVRLLPFSLFLCKLREQRDYDISLVPVPFVSPTLCSISISVFQTELVFSEQYL